MMKNIIYLLAVALVFTSCSKEDVPQMMIEEVPLEGVDYRQEMRDFVIGLSQFAKAQNDTFNVIPQNGIELITNNGEASGSINTAYLNAIDAHGQEDLYYGYNNDDEATPTNESDYVMAFLDVSMDKENVILVTDYCSTPSKMDDSYAKNAAADYIGFAADQRELNNIPTYPVTIVGENDNYVEGMDEVENFLYLINPGNYPSKQAFISAVTATNYDLLIMDLFFDGGDAFTASEITQLKEKANGGKRFVVSYMSIGEAEDYRYYWNANWSVANTPWLDNENPNWPGNYKVRYWAQEWQDVIYGNSDSYLQKVIDANFDGVYLDIVSGFEYYEGL